MKSPFEKAREMYEQIRDYTVTAADARQITIMHALDLRDETGCLYWEDVAYAVAEIKENQHG